MLVCTRAVHLHRSTLPCPQILAEKFHGRGTSDWVLGVERVWLQVSYWSSIRIQSCTFLVILFNFLFSGWLRVCLSFFCVQMPSVWIRLDHLNRRISPLSLSPGISWALCLSQDPLGNSVTCWRVSEVSLCIYTPHFMLFVGSLWLVFGGYGDFFDENGVSLALYICFIVLIGFQGLSKGLEKCSSLAAFNCSPKYFSQNNFPWIKIIIC